MKRVLINIREKCIPELQRYIPRNSEFLIYENIIPVLKVVKKYSDLLSAEVTPTLQLALPALFYIMEAIKTAKNLVPELNANRDIQDALNMTFDALKKQLDDRFPSSGSENEFTCIGHLLHPYYRGSLLKRYGKFDDVVDKMVDDHTSTIEFTEQSRLNQAMISESEDPMEIAMAEEHAQSGNDTKTPPLRGEIERYLKMVPPPEKGDVDILNWWKSHANQFPLLSEEARKYLAIPVTSAPSER